MSDRHKRRANAFASFDEAVRASFTAPPRIKPSEWVEQHRHVSGEANAKTHGKWHNLPPQIEPLDALIEPGVRSVVLMWASQTMGKTEVVNGAVGYFIEHQPSPMIVLQPDLVMAAAWSKDRLSTMIRDTPVLKALLKPKYNKAGNTILHKTFPGGAVTIAGANSPASLSARPIPISIFDEVDRYPESAGKEGDPVLLTEKRADSFGERAISLKTSTPTIARHSRVAKEFELSDKRFWYVKCPKCDREQSLKWSQVKWSDAPTIEETYYLCENEECGARWNDKQRRDAIRAGRWKATAPFNGVRGYHINGIYSLFGPKKGYKTRLHQMAAEFLSAKALGKEALKVWTNTFLAETWADEQEAKPEWRALKARAEAYDLGKIPKGVRVTTFGVDFQADRCELEFVGWGVGEESWGLGHQVIWGDFRQPQPYTELESALIRSFPREDGATLYAKAGGFDTGWAPGQRQLYAYLRLRLGRGYYAFKGNSKFDAEPITHSSRTRVETVKLMMIGTHRIKALIYDRSTISAPGHGYIHTPTGYPDEWYKQLLAEDFVTKYAAGQMHRVFSMPDVILDGMTSRNEALDIRVYAQAALYAQGVINWDFEERRNLATIATTPTAPRRFDLPRVMTGDDLRPKKAKRRAGFLSGVLG